MESKNLIICDPEEGYAQALAFYLMQRRELSFQVQVCSNISHVLAAEEKAGIDILFISEEYTMQERKKIKAGKVFVLTGNGKTKTAEEERVLYKFQSGDKILEEMLRECGKMYKSEEIFRNVGKKNQAKIIGVFSPVHRIGKTTYALKLGEELAVSENVLYLNLEVYSGIGGHFDEEGQTLADVLYYSRQEKGNLGLFLTTIVHHRRNLDYVLPMRVSEDVKGISSGDWEELLCQIMEQSIYETIILDLDDALPELFKLLSLCTQIHMPVIHDACAVSKVRQFERELELLGNEGILGRIVRKEGHI